METQGPEPSSKDVPLLASVARRIIEELFQSKPQWQRSELAAEVERIHQKRGGVKGKQAPTQVVKKALAALQEDGKVFSPAYGLWRWNISEQEDIPHAGLDGNQSVEILDEQDEASPEKEIGEGPEIVYLYYNPNDKKLAELQGRSTWECKIGRTTASDASARIISQGVRTALSHAPIVGLVIRTEDCGALEKALHSSLRSVDKGVADSVGTEWFMTSPAHVERWFVHFQRGLMELGAEKRMG